MIRDLDRIHGRSYAVRARRHSRQVHRTCFALDLAGIPGHMIVLGEVHLRGILKSYAQYYNGVRLIDL
jgi:hypothetical protein